jgi:hypothetical protein
VVVALVVWAVAELGFGMDLRSPANGSEASWDVNPAVVVATSGVASLAAWGLLALLERLAAHPRTVWTATVVLALLISLGGPLSGTGVTGANRVALALMHLAVAAVLIPLLRRTAPNLREQPRGLSLASRLVETFIRVPKDVVRCICREARTVSRSPSFPPTLRPHPAY